MKLLDSIESSYRENNLGDILSSAVLHYRPFKIVEFGVLHGYSTIHMAFALKKLGKGHISAYDLWDRYQYKHTTLELTKKNIIEYDLENYVTLKQVDFFEWLKRPEYFDMLHLDISNDGDIIEQTLSALSERIDRGAVVIFEGGSVDRDNVKWMVDYKKRPINPLMKKFRFKLLDDRFPSISILERRW